jgi:hypothetical protein
MAVEPASPATAVPSGAPVSAPEFPPLLEPDEEPTGSEELSPSPAPESRATLASSKEVP